MGSRLKNAVTVETGKVGEEVYMDRISATDAQKVTTVMVIHHKSILHMTDAESFLWTMTGVISLTIQIDCER